MPVDITERVKRLCEKYPISDIHPSKFAMPVSNRIMTKAESGKSFRRGNDRGIRGKGDKEERLKVKVHGRDGFSLGKKEIDLRYIEQLVDSEQTASLGMLLKYAVEHMVDDRKTIPQIVSYLEKQLKSRGLEFFSEGSYIPGGYAMPRIQEVYSCFNRYRR